MAPEKKTEHFYSNETGDATLTVYTVFPGIQVVYNSVHMNHFSLNIPSYSGNFIEIHHCREGRIEQEFETNFFYLMPGDLSIAKREQMVHDYNFPLRHYHGITIGINTDIAPKCFSSFMEDVTVQPSKVADRLCGEKKCTILRGNSTIEHIFSEIYTIPEEHKIGYLKIKILELLFVLNLIELPDNSSTELTLPRKQVQLAKAVADFLAEHMDKRITIPELSKQFGVSDTHLKNAFKSVYGVPVFSYVRIQKMQSAAQVLIHTDRSVSDISAEFGYNNESKFSAAFREIMGDSPREFRRQHSKVYII